MSSLFFSFLIFLNPAEADNQMDLNGSWGIDVDSAIDRCIRLKLSDCRDPTKAEELRAEIKQRVATNGDAILTFNNGSLTTAFGEQKKTGSYTFLHTGFSYAVLELIDSSANKEILPIFLEAPNVFCIAESAQASDNMCWRRK